MSQPDPRPGSNPGSSPGRRPGAGASPLLLQTKAALAAARPALGAPVVLVPTMGALHSGHRALLRRGPRAGRPGRQRVVSVFVNPLQFRPGEDLDRYPRTLDEDLAMCASEGVEPGVRAVRRRDVPGRPARRHGRTLVRWARYSRASSGPVSSTAC